VYFAIAVPSILCATIDRGQVWNKRREGAENESTRRVDDEEQGQVGESVEVQTRIDLCGFRTRLPNLSIRLNIPLSRRSGYPTFFSFLRPERLKSELYIRKGRRLKFCPEHPPQRLTSVERAKEN